MNSVTKAKRGYVPEDERNFSPSAMKVLRTASGHVEYLINEGYDLKQAVTFVGNHFLLSERQRLSVMRSVATREQLNDRENKSVPVNELAGRDIWMTVLIRLLRLRSWKVTRYSLSAWMERFGIWQP